MRIQTERLILRPLTIDDIDAVGKLLMDIENTKLMVYMPKKNLEEVKKFLNDIEYELNKEKPSYYELAVVLNGSLVGVVSVYFDEAFECGEVGWIVDKLYWGNGYAYEASKAMIEMCLKGINVRKFIAHCDSENKASIRVMEKLGMHLVDKYSGRKNRCSDEIREECKYELCY